ncbi:TolC family outer membrane protein [Luteibacter sp. PPL201]|uniref:TolC family outer membrane protein n=1 Tax=Luteibacter sahnii TaxID=3021977 RepID=A0ABT6BEP1_9GAMM|nr:TolC family outer membrane protein [Luteibacter sp. PPL193]MDY1549771.1 TolC family outer membrane protein [Luteibacter sp. PPL193]
MGTKTWGGRLALAVACVLPSMAGAEDLLDVYRQAVTNDPVLAGADARRLVAAEAVPQARSALLPQLSAGLDLQQFHPGRTGTDGTGGHSRQRDLSVSLGQTVVDVSKFARERGAHDTADAQEETYRGELQNLYVRVASAYFAVLVAQDQLAVFQSYEDAYKQQHDQASELFHDGLAPAADVSQSQAYYFYIRSQRVTAQDALKDAQRALQEITGQLPGHLKTLRDDLPMQPPSPNDAEAWVHQAMDMNPDLLAATHLVRADEHSISAARAGHLPTLGLAVGYGKTGAWSDAARGGAGYGPGSTTVGLTLTVPLFSGGLTQSQVRQAIHQRDADQDDLEVLRRRTARDAYNYFNLVVDGIGQVGDARGSVEAAKKAVASMRAGYDIGTQTLTNVVVAIETLANVRSQYIAVRHQFILNKLLLKRAAGVASLDDIQDINRLLE